MNVLIAEDDHAAAETLREYLETNGFSCAIENDGIGARKHFSRDFQAVILDVILPAGPGGLELLVEVKERYPDIKVFVVSGFNIPETRVKSLELGADFFFPKPLDLKLLLKHLQNSKN